MISSVSFGNVPFADLIKTPQAHRTAEQPVAQSPIGGENKSSKGKKLLGLAAVTAGVVGLVVLAKKGKLSIADLKDGKLKDWLQKDGQTQKFVKSIVKGYKNIGSQIYDLGENAINASWKFIKDIPNKFGGLMNKGKEAADEVIEKGQEVAQEIIEQA